MYCFISGTEYEIQFGEELFERVQTTAVNCTVLDGIECSGDQSFIRTNVPCVRLVIAQLVHTLTLDSNFSFYSGIKAIIFRVYSYILCFWEFWVWTVFVWGILVMV